MSSHRTLILYGIVFGTCLALGGAHSVVHMSVIGLAGYLIYLGKDLKTEHGYGFWIAMMAVFFSLLQLIPLPIGFVAMLRPISADTAWPPNSGWSILSLSLTRTLAGCLRWLAAAWVILLFSHIIPRDRMRRAACWIAFGVGCLTSAVGFFHRHMHLVKIYGIFGPFMPSSYFRGPFINSNHECSALAVGFFCGLSLFFRDTHATFAKRVLWLVVLVLIACPIFLTGSMGGQIAFICLLTATSLMGSPAGRYSLGFGLCATIVLAAFALILLPFVIPYNATDLDWYVRPLRKIRFVLDGISSIARYPWTGVGTDGFSISAWQVTQRDWGEAFALESEALNFIIDWGIIGGCIFLALITMAWMKGYRRCLHHAYRWPIMAAISHPILHGMMDFPLRTLGILIPWLLLIEAHCGVVGKRFNEVFPFHRRKLVGIITVLAVHLGVLLGVVNHEKFYQKSLWWHPESPVLRTSYARSLVIDGRWHTAKQELNVVLDAAPSFAYAHLLAGYIEAKQGHRRLALSEYLNFVRLKPSDWETGKRFLSAIDPRVSPIGSPWHTDQPVCKRVVDLLEDPKELNQFSWLEAESICSHTMYPDFLLEALRRSHPVQARIILDDWIRRQPEKANLHSQFLGILRDSKVPESIYREALLRAIAWARPAGQFYIEAIRFAYDYDHDIVEARRIADQFLKNAIEPSERFYAYASEGHIASVLKDSIRAKKFYRDALNWSNSREEANGLLREHLRWMGHHDQMTEFLEKKIDERWGSGK